MAQKSFEKLVASVGSSGRGLHRSKLPPGDLAKIKKFGTYLKSVEHKSDNTARAYQSWVAKAKVEGGVGDNSHVKSALRAFGRYLKTK
jgi:hypothetical protein